jgi:hypothetical protein
MTTLRSTTFVLALFAVAAAVHAQDYQAMAQAMEKAQADAAKPGDDKLTCEQLEEQLIAMTQDPAFQAHVEAAGAEAQKRQAEIDAAKGQVAMQKFRTVMMSMVPGAAMPGMAAAQAQAQAQGANAMKQNADRMQQAERMMALMPMLMRGQRVIELASAKKCEWAEAAGTPQ